MYTSANMCAWVRELRRHVPWRDRGRVSSAGMKRSEDHGQDSRFGKLDNRWGRKPVKINNKVYSLYWKTIRGRTTVSSQKGDNTTADTAAEWRGRGFFPVRNNRRHDIYITITYTADGTSADAPRRRRRLLCDVRRAARACSNQNGLPGTVANDTYFSMDTAHRQRTVISFVSCMLHCFLTVRHNLIIYC